MKFKQYLNEKYMPTEWWEKGSTITLYHGTTWTTAQRIKKEGLKVLNVKDMVFDMLKSFGIKDPNSVPDWVTSEISLRKENRIYLANKKSEAINYAKTVSPFGGEAGTQTARKIMKYLGVPEDELYNKLKPKNLELGIVTVDMPWSEAKTYRSLTQTLLRAKQVYGDKWKKELSKGSGFEFFTEQPIPKKYIVRIDKI